MIGTSDHLVFIPLTVTLRTPVLLPVEGGDPNMASTRAHIPGSTLLGAAIAACVDDAQRATMLSPDVVMLPAYPLADGDRALPLPLSIRRRPGQETGETFIDLAVEDGSSADRSMGRMYAAIGYSGYVSAPLRLGARHHHERDRVAGAPTKNAGAIFVYQYVAAGSRLQALVRYTGPEPDEFVGLLEPLANGTWTVGRRKTVEYGEVHVAVGEPRHTELADDFQLMELAQDDSAVVLLTSPAVCRDPFSGLTGCSVLAGEVRRLFGPRVELGPVFTADENVTTFNRLNGVPSIEHHAAAAGSVVVITAKEAIDAATLRNLIARGLGGRQHDGLGSFIVLSPANRVYLQPAAMVEPRFARPDSTKGLPPFLRVAQRRLLTRELTERVAGLARTLDLRPPASRSVIRRLISALDESPDTLGRAIQEVGPTFAPKALGSVESARVGNDSLRTWIRTMLSRTELPEGVEMAGHLLLNERSHDRLAERLATMANAAYVRAVLVRMHREAADR